MDFAIFAFNRGEFLENCVRSIERFAPGAGITVFDDDSDDEATRRVLETIAVAHRVVSPGPAATGAGKHGGLYANMQAALGQFDDDADVCFLQDDMQIVRPLGAPDLEAIARYFDAFGDAAFVQPAFFKGCNRASDGVLTRYDANAGGYIVGRLSRSAGAYYSDVHVTRPGRLRATGWRYLDREAHNEQQARAAFRPLLYLKNPFAAWLPHAPAYRGKRLTWALSTAQRLADCGLYPFRGLSEAETARFLERAPETLPFAEDFLALERARLPEPWIYHPLQGRRLLKLLNSVELKLRGAR